MLYLYGIIDAPGPVVFSCAGRDIYNVPCRELSVLVSAGDRSMSGVSAENVLAHGEVLKAVMQDYTVLPVRFGTLLSGGSEAEALLSRNYEVFLSSLQEAGGMVEMSVKALWDTAEAEEYCRQKYAAGGVGESLPEKPGTAFLMQKKKQLLWEQCLKDSAAARAGDIHLRLARPAVKQIQRILPSRGIFYHGSHMIPRDRAGEFEEDFKALRDDFTQYKFLLSGPWPLYSFVSIKCR